MKLTLYICVFPWHSDIILCKRITCSWGYVTSWLYLEVSSSLSFSSWLILHLSSSSLSKPRPSLCSWPVTPLGLEWEWHQCAQYSVICVSVSHSSHYSDLLISCRSLWVVWFMVQGWDARRDALLCPPFLRLARSRARSSPRCVCQLSDMISASCYCPLHLKHTHTHTHRVCCMLCTIYTQKVKWVFS